MKWRWISIAGVLLSLCAAGCTASRPVAASSAPDSARSQGGLLAIPPDQLAHLKIATVERTAWATAVHATGTVDWNGDLTTPVLTTVSGPIVRILANVGDRVTGGQPLLYVSSPDVSNAVAAYRKARNRMTLERRALDRASDLFEHNAIARKDYESAESDFNDASTDLQNSLQALRIWGIGQDQIDAADRQGAAIDPQLAVRAPVSGVVVQKLIAPGQLIQAGSTTCYVISDVSTVWVQGHIFDRDLTSVRVGDAAEESNPALPVVFHGKVEYIGAMLDPATRTTPVRIATRNPGGLLKKDMYVDAVIRTGTKRDVLTVPVAAVLRNAQNEPFVYVEAEPGRFARRVVSTGVQQDGKVEIAGGLADGEKVVAEGSVFLQFVNSAQ